MRISSTLFFQTGLNAINAQQADLMHLYQQTASGQRMVTPADDPLAAAQAINLRQSQSLNQRFADNREVLKNNLGAEENALNSTTLLLQDVKTRLIEAGNGTMSDADRATLADVLQSAKENMLGLANSADGNGQYLFSGHAGTRPPFVKDASGAVSYQGDAGQRLVQADQTRQIASSDVGTDIFASAPAGSRSYVTAGDSGNAGTGVIGKPVITDPDGDNVGKPFSIEFVEDNSGTEPVLRYTITVTEPDGSTTETVADYEPGTTSLSLPGGLQVAFSGSPADGDTFTVEPAASPGTNLNIFDTLDDVIAALKAPASGVDRAQASLANTLATAIQKIDLNYDQVLTVRASVGARMNEVDDIDANGSLRSLSYSNQLSKLEDVDYYTVTAQLQLRQAALEAAALAFKKIQGTSLFNMGSN